jgi:hypothetical protein
LLLATVLGTNPERSAVDRDDQPAARAERLKQSGEDFATAFLGFTSAASMIGGIAIFRRGRRHLIKMADAPDFAGK